MAIGLGKMFGFHFNENFNLPYTSESISEFWRRWHISLSSWFRDYVYIPLGGNRNRVYLNLAIVFILTGIWHGASWHFVAWGIWNGFFIIVERALKNKNEKKSLKKSNLVRQIFSKTYTLLIVNFGWVLFRAPHMKDAAKYILAMFGVSDDAKVGYTFLWYLDRWTVTIMVLAVFFSSSIPTGIYGFLKKHISGNIMIPLKYTVLLILLYISMIRIVSGTYNPFIYFQF